MNGNEGASYHNVRYFCRLKKAASAGCRARGSLLLDRPPGVRASPKPERSGLGVISEPAPG
jgi:hypothetical protein